MNATECVSRYKHYKTEKQNIAEQRVQKKIEKTRYEFHRARYDKAQEYKLKKLQGIPGRVATWVAERGEDNMEIPGMQFIANA